MVQTDGGEQVSALVEYLTEGYGVNGDFITALAALDEEGEDQVLGLISLMETFLGSEEAAVHVLTHGDVLDDLERVVADLTRFDAQQRDFQQVRSYVGENPDPILEYVALVGLALTHATVYPIPEDQLHHFYSRGSLRAYLREKGSEPQFTNGAGDNGKDDDDAAVCVLHEYPLFRPDNPDGRKYLAALVKDGRLKVTSKYRWTVKAADREIPGEYVNGGFGVLKAVRQQVIEAARATGEQLTPNLRLDTDNLVLSVRNERTATLLRELRAMAYDEN